VPDAADPPPPIAGLDARFDEILRHVPGMVYQFQFWPETRKSCFPYASEGIRSIYRLTPDEVRFDAEPSFQRIHPEDRARVLQSIIESARSLAPWRCEYRVQFDGESPEWLEGYSTPSAQSDGSVLWHGFITNITERKQVETELRQNRERLATFIEQTPAAIALFDTGMCYIAASKKWISQHDLPADLIGRHHYDVSPDVPERWREGHRRCLAGAIERSEHDVWFPPKWDRAQHIRWEVRPWRLTDGAIGGISILTEDVTEKAEVEISLRDSEARWQFALEGSGDGIWDWNILTGQVFFSRQWKSMLGYDEDAIADRIEEWRSRVHPDDLALCIVALEEHFSGNSPTFVCEHRQMAKDGHYKCVLSRGRVIERTSDLKPARIIVTQTDVSWRREIEDELRRARDAAEAANRAKSAFVATMSHEIRTPLNGVIGFSQLLAETELDDDQRDCVQSIGSSAEALLSLINDILDFAKIEAGKIESDPAPFSLLQCIEEVMDIFWLAASKKGLEFGCEIDPDVPLAVVGDIGRLRQILVNLVSNAVKFTGSGRVILRVEMLAGAPGQRLQTCFRVQDSGDGIPEDRVERLFQPFSQVDASITRRFGGTGLGLAISKRLVELMGGTIWLESKPGEGATFSFTADLPEDSSRELLPAQEPGDLLDGLRVLVADPLPANCRLIEVFLGWWGIHSRTATCWGEVESALDDGVTDVILLSRALPDLPDAETLQNFWNTLPDPPLRIGLRWNAHRSPHDSAEPTLVKPIKALALRACLLRLIGAERPGDRGPGQPVSLSDRGRGLRVLVAEDNSVNKKLIGRFLTSLGVEFEIVSNGRQAIEASATGGHQIILMDCQMPEMDGLEATRLIRQRERESGGGQRATIIALTAGALAADRADAVAAGMDDYLTKPLKLESIAAALERALAAP